VSSKKNKIEGKIFPSIFVHFYLLTKFQKYGKIGGALTALARRISIIPPRQQFVNRQNEQISSSEKSRICTLLPVDICAPLCYTIIVKRARV
jgi:hypothetical protein